MGTGPSRKTFRAWKFAIVCSAPLDRRLPSASPTLSMESAADPTISSGKPSGCPLNMAGEARIFPPWSFSMALRTVAGTASMPIRALDTLF